MNSKPIELDLIDHLLQETYKEENRNQNEFFIQENSSIPLEKVEVTKKSPNILWINNTNEIKLSHIILKASYIEKLRCFRIDTNDKDLDFPETWNIFKEIKSIYFGKQTERSIFIFWDDLKEKIEDKIQLNKIFSKLMNTKISKIVIETKLHELNFIIWYFN
jgi:hypothetical protein